MNEAKYMGFTTSDYLDAVGEKFGLSTDNQIAKKLNISRGAVSQYRSGVRAMDDYCAMQIASFLAINPMMVIAAANEKREKSEPKKQYWREIQATLGTGGSLFYGIMIAIPYGQELIHKFCILC